MKPALIIGAAALGVTLLVGGVFTKTELDRQATEEAARRAEEARLARIEAAWDARLATATSLAQAVNLQGGLIRCIVEDPNAVPQRATGDAAADALLTVSEQPLIVFIAHGFEIQSSDGRRSAQLMTDEFAGHFSLIQSQPGGSAICLTSWYSFDGFGDHQPHLGDAMAAVRHLSEDALLPEIERRRVVAVGYSQGGNFVKHAAVRAIDLQPSFTPQDLGVRPTLLRVVGLGVPNHGAPIAYNGLNAGRTVATLSGFFAMLNNDQQGLQSASNALGAMNDLSNTRGMRQMAVNNGELRDLNAQVAAHVDRMEYVNILSFDDDVVPYDYSSTNVGLQQTMSGMLHRDWPRPVAGSRYAEVLNLVYGEASLTQEN